MDAEARIAWATRRFESAVGHEGFRMFFAVHEIEACLLSDPRVFPREVASALLAGGGRPEAVDFERPPAKLLDELYRTKLKTRYKKVTYGPSLFGKLDPEVAYGRCPNLKRMLDTMLELARRAGL
jgi:hypothetical protein